MTVLCERSCLCEDTHVTGPPQDSVSTQLTFLRPRRSTICTRRASRDLAAGAFCQERSRVLLIIWVRMRPWVRRPEMLTQIFLRIQTLMNVQLRNYTFTQFFPQYESFPKQPFKNKNFIFLIQKRSECDHFYVHVLPLILVLNILTDLFTVYPCCCSLIYFSCKNRMMNFLFIY